MLIQTLAFVQALALAVLTFTDTVRVPHLIALALFLGAITAFETPTRQAFLLELIEHRETCPTRSPCNRCCSSRRVSSGRPLRAWCLAAFGEAWCFVLNALFYLAIIVTYRDRPRETTQAARHGEPSGGASWRLDSPTPSASRARGVFCCSSRRWDFHTAPWSSLMPIFAAETFKRRLEDLRLSHRRGGAGAILGTFALAARGSVRGLGRLIAAAAVTAGVALTGFSWSGTLWLSLVFLAIFGAGLVVTAASINTILQTVADEDKRARVISMYVMCFLGLALSATSPRVRSPRRSGLTGLYSDAALSWSSQEAPSPWV